MKYYTIRQVANVTGAKVRTVREWIRLGKLKGVKDPISHRWYFAEKDVKKLVFNPKKRGADIDNEN